MTVTCRRSAELDADEASCGCGVFAAEDALAASRTPQLPQKFAVDGLAWPQPRQRTGIAVPQLLQNRLPDGTSAAQLGHCRTLASLLSSLPPTLTRAHVYRRLKAD
jgi:hypothetical protein